MIYLFHDCAITINKFVDVLEALVWVFSVLRAFNIFLLRKGPFWLQYGLNGHFKNELENMKFSQLET